MTFYNIPSQYKTISAAVAVAVDGDDFNVETKYAGNETVAVTVDDAVFDFYSTAPNVTFNLANYVSNLHIDGPALVQVNGNAGNNEIDGGHIVDGKTGSDSIRGTNANDTISVNIDGNDNLHGDGGSDTFILSGVSGTGGSIDGANDNAGDIDTVKANNLGGFVFYEVEKLDTKNVVATISQLKSFNTIEDSTAASTPIAIHLHGAGDQINFFGLVHGTDSVRVYDDGLADSVSETGTAYADLLSGSLYGDFLSGGGGSDTYIVNDTRDQVVESVNQGLDLVQSSVTFTLGDNVDNLLLTGGAAINGTGNGLHNTLTGNGAANVLDGGQNTDTMKGLAGDDTYVVDAAGDNVFESANQGDDLVVSTVSYTLGDNLENLTLAGADPINGTGNAADNVLIGNSGVNGLTGKEGNDTYVVQNTNDVVVESAKQGTDLVEASVSFSLSANVEDLTLTGKAAINGKGNTLDNHITGNAGANTLDGGVGADLLKGLGGNDTYFVDNKKDTVVETVNSGVDLVVSSLDYTLGSNVENLTLTGKGSIDGAGNALGNTITGNVSRNVLEGGAGIDVLRGGAGADAFLFDTALNTKNIDHIRDFTSADRIHLENKIFKGLKNGTLSTAAFKDLSKGDVDADDRILYDHKTGSLYYDRDGSGGGHAYKIAILDNHAGLSHGEILIV